MLVTRQPSPRGQCREAAGHCLCAFRLVPGQLGLGLELTLQQSPVYTTGPQAPQPRPHLPAWGHKVGAPERLGSPGWGSVHSSLKVSEGPGDKMDPPQNSEMGNASNSGLVSKFKGPEKHPA